MNNASLAGVVGKGTAWLAGTTVLLKGVGFISIFIILTHLSVYEYGFAELVITAVPLLSIFLLPGLGPTVIADMAAAKGRGDIAEMKGLLFSFTGLLVCLSVVAWALVFFGADILAVWYHNPSAVLLFKIVSFSFLISPWRTFAQVLQSVYLRFRQQSMQSISEEVWKLILLCVFLLGLHMGPTGLVYAIVLSPFLSLLTIAVPLARMDVRFWSTPRKRFSLFHFLFDHGKWAVFSNYLGTFGKNIRPWIIKLFLGTEAVAIYAVAQGLIGHVVSLMPLDTVLKPLLPQYVDTPRKFYQLISKAIKYELLGYFVVSVASAIGVPILVAWFFPHYATAIPLFEITLFMLVSSAFDAVFTGAFFALQAQRSMFWASLYKLVLIIILLPPFMHYFGLWGIAYANILSNSLYVWERYLKLKKLMPGFKLSFRSFVTIDELDRVIMQRIVQFVARAPGLGFLLQHSANTPAK